MIFKHVKTLMKSSPESALYRVSHIASQYLRMLSPFYSGECVDFIRLPVREMQSETSVPHEEVSYCAIDGAPLKLE